MLLPAESGPITKEKEALESFASAPLEPPPYSPSSSGPSLKRVNNLYIKERDASIRGTYLIDPNLRIPPTLLPKVAEGARMDNLHVESKDGTVALQLRLESDTPTKSYLYIESCDGRITTNIISRVNQKFQLTVKNRDSSLTVFIPRDFYGPVSYVNKDSTTNFSEAVTAHLTPLGQHKRQGRAFIGQFEGSGYGEKEDEPWEGDELILANKDAKIWVYYSDEEVPVCAKKGFFERLFRSD